MVAALAPALSAGGVLVDCTLGGGGHAEALLAAAPQACLVGLDRDSSARDAAAATLAPFGGRVTLVGRSFRELGDVLAGLRPETDRAGGIAAVLYDLGVSSAHLDQPDRGFGFRLDGPLDMRMDRSQAFTAADIVNTYSAGDLSRVLARWGEERFAGRIAGAIVRRRAQRPFESTADLADVVRAAIPAATRRSGPHPARRTFQALRIEVNDEIGQLEASLPQAIAALEPGGRVAVISYHSLEDRFVKRTFVAGAQGCRCPRDLPVCVCGAHADLRILNRKGVTASPEELAENPRSSSARLRVAERLAPAEAA